MVLIFVFLYPDIESQRYESGNLAAAGISVTEFGYEYDDSPVTETHAPQGLGESLDQRVVFHCIALLVIELERA